MISGLLHGSLRLRMFTAMLLVFALGFIPIAMYVYAARDDLRRGVMFIQAQEISRGFTAQSDLSLLPASYAGGELSYTLYSPAGDVLWLSDNLDQPRRLWTSLWAQKNTWFQWPRDRGRVINVPAFLDDGSILMIAKHDRLEREMIGRLLQERMRYGLVALLPTGLACAALILLLLHWTLRPVRLATRLAEQIGPNSSIQRIPAHKLPREIGALADAVNHALGRLSNAYEHEKRFVADAAHELRTPLTVIDLRLQSLRQGKQTDWSAVDRELQDMRRLIEQLLALARHDDAPGTDDRALSRLSMARCARETVASLLPLFERSGRALVADIADSPLHARGKDSDLQEAMRNLLENALVHGTGTVLVRAYAQDAWAHFEVQDEGGSQGQDDALFSRFQKRSGASPGAGLGLAIVRQIAANYGGQASFAPGGLWCVRLSLRLEPAAPVH